MKEKASGTEDHWIILVPNHAAKFNAYLIIYNYFFLNITHRPLDQLNYAPYEMMAVTRGKLELAPGREKLFPLQ